MSGFWQKRFAPPSGPFWATIASWMHPPPQIGRKEHFSLIHSSVRFHSSNRSSRRYSPGLSVTIPKSYSVRPEVQKHFCNAPFGCRMAEWRAIATHHGPVMNSSGIAKPCCCATDQMATAFSPSVVSEIEKAKWSISSRSLRSKWFLTNWSLFVVE